MSQRLLRHPNGSFIFIFLPRWTLTAFRVPCFRDGRYYNSVAIQTIIRMAAANAVGRVWVGKDGLMSTPAVSAVLREREGGAAYIGFVLTARCADEIRLVPCFRCDLNRFAGGIRWSSLPWRCGRLHCSGREVVPPKEVQ